MVIKLNFDLAPEALKRLRRSNTIRRIAHRPAKTSRHHLVLFDTAERALRARGLTLALRRSNGSWTQEIQGSSAAETNAGEPPAYRWPLPSANLDVALLKHTCYSGLLKKKHLRQLVPMFTIEFARTVSALQLGEDCSAELHIDVGRSLAQSRVERVCQARLVLNSGDPTRLFSVALELLRCIPMRLSHHSAEERTFVLALGVADKPGKAAGIELRSEMPTLAAEHAIAAGCATQIQSNATGFLSGNEPEYLHQLRVGWRRLRCATSMPDSALWRDLPNLLRSELRWIWGTLGAARSWDVLVDELLPAMTAEAASNRRRAYELQMLRKRCDVTRLRRVDAARAAIRSARYQRLLLNVAWIVLDSHASTDPNDELAPHYSVHEFATEALKRYGRRLKKRLHLLALASAAERHQARIAAKKLRYACEFFESLFRGPATQRYLRRLVALQDALGRLNDLASGALLLEHAGSSKEAPLAAPTRELIGRWLRSEEAVARERLEVARRRFCDQPAFWTAAASEEISPSKLRQHAAVLALRDERVHQPS